MEEQNKKVEAEVIEDFFDYCYGKERKVGNIFICDKELALKRKHFSINGQERPLVKILRDVPDDTPEEEKAIKSIMDIIKEKFQSSTNNTK